MSASTDAAIVAANSSAVDRMTAALAGKTRGWRGPNHGKMQGRARIQELQHAAFTAGDVADVAGQINQRSEIVQSQYNACSALPPETEVILYADHGFHILDELAKQSSKPAAPVPAHAKS